ncbi:GNAT family N-acetyltransferase [Pseudoalteromonas umbrosa]|uniref:GNAT family N-acetyltransferase n=1 Tax=Pseudoalteromonas umbrosa TaxID=3048489 RepID=UPI0024C3B04C|nr:GNAT family N-acetyltransferase [Pseudoalteromonas sp. B95]MDK1287319.1 GNAT family N-acetyltransferase [Pseudoalteromonas sp. B95]
MAKIPEYHGVAELVTKRLVLRQWQEIDKGRFAQMNADPEVMRYFPSKLNIDESNALCDKIAALIDERGYGFWAVELQEGNEVTVTSPSTDRFIGFVGLHWQTRVNPKHPFMEIGWRLHRDFWGQGYAYEAAQAALKFAFELLSVEQVYAFTALQNRPSQQLMRRLGMTNLNKNFAHPDLPDGHVLQSHCLYGVTRDEFENKQLV